MSLTIRYFYYTVSLYKKLIWTRPTELSTFLKKEGLFVRLTISSTKKAFHVSSQTWYILPIHILYIINSIEDGDEWAGGSSWHACSARAPHHPAPSCLKVHTGKAEHLFRFRLSQALPLVTAFLSIFLDTCWNTTLKGQCRRFDIS